MGLALRQVRRELPARKAPLLGLSAAFLFAAQMVNFPWRRTSGHLVGGTLVAALLGTERGGGGGHDGADCAMFSVPGRRRDGAGGEYFNMAILNSAVGYAVYRRCAIG